MLHVESLENRVVPAFPQAVPDSFDVTGFGPSRLNVLANDPFPASLRVSEVTQPNQGRVEINSDGSLTFFPAVGFRSTSFNYTVDARNPETILTAATPATDDFFGKTVISGDGNTLAISADSANIGGSIDAGRVFIFQRNNGGWTLTQNLTASDPAGQDRFGFASALSSDGATLIVGAPGADVNGGDNAGKVYVFRRDTAGNFVQMQVITDPSAEANGNFGGSLGISGDGTTVAIGATGATVGGQAQAGHVVIAQRNGDTLVPMQTINASSIAVGDGFGNVALSQDGNTLAVGAFAADVNGVSNAGRVTIFGRNWTFVPIQEIVSPEIQADQLFGNAAIALDATGSQLVVGALLADVNGQANAGKVYVFGRNGTFSLRDNIQAPTPTMNDGFGASVAISADGRTLIVGAPLMNANGITDSGQGFVYTRGDGNFGLIQSITASDAAAGDNFAISSAVGNDGNTFVFGATLADVGTASNGGKAYVRERGRSTASVSLTRSDDAASGKLATTGLANGTANIFRFDTSGLAQLESTFKPFDNYNGPIQATIGDVNGDGIADAIYGIGPGGGSVLRVISGATGQDLVPPMFTFEISFAGGIFVAAGDIDGDGDDEIAVAPDVGGGGRIHIFSFENGMLVQRDNFFGIEDENFRGGARIAIGDINGDGRGDLVVGAGFGGGPRIAVFNGQGLLQGQTTPPKLLPDFFAFPGPDAITLRDGVYVSAKDMDGDGKADFLFGGGPGGGPRVFILRGPDVLNNVDAAQSNPLANFFVANDSTSRGGIRVTAKDVDADGKFDLIVGSGEKLPARVRTYGGPFPQPGMEPSLRQDFDPFGTGSVVAGVFVG